MFSVKVGFTYLHRGPERSLQVNPRFIQLHLSRVDARQVNQVFNQPNLQVHVAANGADVGKHLGWERRVVLQHFRRHQHRA